MARLLAETLSQKHKVIYSIKGSTTNAQLPKNCEIKTGGFGGTMGLATYITAQNISLVIDASHPFATNISQNAINACEQVGIKIIQYARKLWKVKIGQEFKTAEALITALPDDARILLTIGGQNIRPFSNLKQLTFARMIEPPKLKGKHLPTNFELIYSRPPYMLDDEIELLKKLKISHLICKNSGGDKLTAKLIAAQKLGIETFMLAQPKSPHKIQFFSINEIETYLNNLSLVSPS